MIIPATKLVDIIQPAIQTIIVGGGAVGLTMAVDLARSGRQVTVLEAGPDTVSKSSQRHFESAISVGRILEGLHHGRFRALGGTTNFWGGQIVRFDPLVFGQRSWLGNSVAWPFDRCALDPFYDRALELLGMQKAIDDDISVMRRVAISPPPLPEQLEFFFTRWLPEPNLAIRFKNDINSLQNLRIITGATVVSLTSNKANPEQLTGVTVIDERGRRLEFNSDRVVLANGTIEIARLLSVPLSEEREAPWNRNLWLGRGFIDHLDCDVGDVQLIDKQRFHDLFDNLFIDGIKYTPKLKLAESAQIGHELLGASGHFLFSSELTERALDAKIFFKSILRGRFKGSWLNLPKHLASAIAVGLPMLVRYFRSHRVYNYTDGGVRLRVSLEQKQIAESGLILRKEVDEFGLPLVALDWRVEGSEIETLSFFSERVADYLSKAGIAQMRLNENILRRDRELLDSAEDTCHHMGMARMSNDAATGVVDKDLKVYGSANLFVAGAAVFPSSGCCNPTFTAIALGLRLSNSIQRGKV